MHQRKLPHQSMARASCCAALRCCKPIHHCQKRVRVPRRDRRQWSQLCGHHGLHCCVQPLLTCVGGSLSIEAATLAIPWRAAAAPPATCTPPSPSGIATTATATCRRSIARSLVCRVRGTSLGGMHECWALPASILHACRSIKQQEMRCLHVHWRRLLPVTTLGASHCQTAEVAGRMRNPPLPYDDHRQ